MHLDPGQSFAKMAFGKCQSTEELSREHAFPTVVVSPSDSPTSTHSLMDLSLTSTEQQAVERLQSSRNQLQQEIEVRSGRYMQPTLARWCDRAMCLMSMGWRLTELVVRVRACFRPAFGWKVKDETPLPGQLEVIHAIARAWSWEVCGWVWLCACCLGPPYSI